ncbi:MAG: hypothetical protein H5T99_08340 [Moorella sp. (in: Bacteria)]|nr:hypothetical protein [Moorella sp. (in: firmicutes)]
MKKLEGAGEELLNRSLAGLEALGLVIDGVVIAEHTAAGVLGMDSAGKKHFLGVWERLLRLPASAVGR